MEKDEIFNKFCHTENLSLFDQLPLHVKEVFVKYSIYSVMNNKGRVEFARRILSNRKKGTELFILQNWIKLNLERIPDSIVTDSSIEKITKIEFVSENIKIIYEYSIFKVNNKIASIQKIIDILATNIKNTSINIYSQSKNKNIYTYIITQKDGNDVKFFTNFHEQNGNYTGKISYDVSKAYNKIISTNMLKGKQFPKDI